MKREVRDYIEDRLWCTNKEVLDSSALQHASKKEGERTLPLSKEDATPMRWSESKKFMHQRLEDIINAMDKAMNFTKGMSYEEFIRDVGGA